MSLLLLFPSGGAAPTSKVVKVKTSTGYITATTVKVWNGTSWTTAVVKAWNGTTWTT